MSFAIYNEDCLEGMKRLADKSVDLIVTDPPFAVGLTSNGIRGTYEDLNLLRPFWELCLTEWRHVLKDGAQIYVNTDWRTYPFLYPILQKFFVPRNTGGIAMTNFTNLEIDEVSLVDAGANLEADILIFKRDEKSSDFDELSATLKSLTYKLNAHVEKAEVTEFRAINERYEILVVDVEKLAPMLKTASKSNPMF